MTGDINNLSKYRKARKTFGKLFLVSFSIFVVSLLLSPLFFYQTLNSQAPDLSDAPVGNMNSASYNRPIRNTRLEILPQLTPVTARESGFPVVLIVFFVTGTVSFLAAVFTFLGFLTMTVFAWKKDKREVVSFNLEKEKKEIEIEKLKIELEKSKSTPAAKIKKCVSCSRTYSDVSLNFCLDDGALLSEIYTSENFGQNPFEKTRVMESNLPTEQISAKTDEIKNKNTAK
ncbi:hypothetical protein BH20ACI4_BH20ACI4_26890 [soil metagenome]